ncbi:MAG: hypothetical protein AAFZ52_13140, partial [Bacteroidota bacterium]
PFQRMVTLGDQILNLPRYKWQQKFILNHIFNRHLLPSLPPLLAGHIPKQKSPCHEGQELFL